MDADSCFYIFSDSDPNDWLFKILNANNANVGNSIGNILIL
ncbi:hypothetical protein AM1_1905 [Acaryochloris marina MBIC11017]|uniref:Uncharacterized protein n=1 Tax=Acaryochloris marina (strain MBIC 11017) TaxID=329726 RepID=B0CEF7_ACAM1|nr:hypothetical protein AM1_1905 [Acaryochloris marina MBIC11017]